MDRINDLYTPDHDRTWPFGEPNDTEVEAALRRVHQLEEEQVYMASEETPRMALEHHKNCIRNWNLHRKSLKRGIKS